MFSLFHPFNSDFKNYSVYPFVENRSVFQKIDPMERKNIAQFLIHDTSIQSVCPSISLSYTDTHSFDSFCIHPFSLHFIPLSQSALLRQFVQISFNIELCSTAQKNCDFVVSWNFIVSKFSALINESKNESQFFQEA